MTQRVNLFLSLILLCVVITSSFSQGSSEPVYAVTSYGYITFSGSVTGESIAYQSNYYPIQNIQNPVLVYVNYDAGSTNQDANVCLNSRQGTFPVSGVNLQNSCPNGGFGIVSNTTIASSPTQLYKRSRIMSDKANQIAKLVEDSSESQNANVYVKPSQDAGFVVTIPGLDSATTINFNVYVTATYCIDPDLYPIGADGTCLPISDITSSISTTVPANSWVYYRYNAGNLDTTVLDYFYFYQNNTNIQMYVQSGYIPTDTWHLDTVIEEDSAEFQYIYTPSRFPLSSEEFYYVGLYNADSSNSQDVYLNVTVGTCDSSSSFGVNCQVSTLNVTDPIYGVVPLSANISSPASVSTFDASNANTYDDAYAYYVITDLPQDIGDNYFVRVSVGNNNLGKYDLAPSLYAKLNGYPSPQSYDYTIANEDLTLVNQLSLPITDPVNDVWYIMVALPAYYTIWVGENCENNCVGYDGEGTCTCSQNGVAVPCSNFTSTSGTVSGYYNIPTNLADSSGVCLCSDSSYSKSFNCSVKPNYNIPYLVLLLLIGLVIIAIAIAVPIYRYVKRHKSNYDPL